MNGVELVASTSDIGFVTDREGVIHGWNKAAEECFDVVAGDALGKCCWEVLQGRDAYGNEYCGPNCPLMRMALEGKRVRRCQLSFCSASGVAQPYSVMTLLLRGVEPLDPAVVHFLHPAVWDRRSAAGQKPEGPANHERGALTSREFEVLALLAKARSTAAVARSLCISQATASNHIQHILHKLHVHSRLEAVVVARKLELI